MRILNNRLPTLIILLIMLTLLSTAALEKTKQVSAASTANQVISLSSEPGGGEISPLSPAVGWQPATRPWTRERMLAAKPYPVGLDHSSPANTTSLPASQGIPGVIPSSAPQGSESGNLSTGNGDFFSRSALLEQVFPYTYIPPYTSYQNFDSYQRFPYSTVGVLFFSQGGVDYQCTAASIGLDAVWTAGRCIHDGNGTGDGWSSEVVFVPAYKDPTYKDGDAPNGQWSAYNLWVKGQWYTYANPSFDMGGVKLNTNASGKMLSQVVGSLGFSYNLNVTQAWFSIGYPDDPPFDGNRQQICAASYAYRDTSQSSPNPIAMGCNMNGGAAGGPWIINFSGSSGSSNFLNGNSSYQAPVEPEAMYSPYFGDAAKSLFSRLMAQNYHYLPIISKDQN